MRAAILAALGGVALGVGACLLWGAYASTFGVCPFMFFTWLLAIRYFERNR